MNVAETIVEKFGGTRKMAAELGLPPSTIQSWKASGLIPAARQVDVLQHANRLGLGLTPADFFPSSIVSAPTPLPVTPTAPEPHSDPASLAAILDQLGGHDVIAEGARIPVTDLEAMQAEGRIWTQYRDALVAFARDFGGSDLDPEKLIMRARGKDAWRAA
jgi:hypothetical protein